MESNQTTPESLAHRLAGLHQEAFGWALSCCGWDEPMAEDVVQTAYMRVLSGRATFGGRSSFRTWLFGVIRRVAQEHRRREQSMEARSTAWGASQEERLTVVEDPIEGVTRAESSRRLLEALGRLPDRQREVLHLVFYDGMTIAESAEVLGVSVGSARTHYDRGKKRMRALLEEVGGE